MPGIYCCVPGCRSFHKKEGGISFFNFPRDPDIREAWVDIIDMNPNILVKHQRVCSNHFMQEDFKIMGDGRRSLIPAAVPSCEKQLLQVKMQPLQDLPALLLDLWKVLPEDQRLRSGNQLNGEEERLDAKDILIDVYEYITGLPGSNGSNKVYKNQSPLRDQTNIQTIAEEPEASTTKSCYTYINNDDKFVHNTSDKSIKLQIPPTGQLFTLPNGKKHLYIPKSSTSKKTFSIILSIPPGAKYSISTNKSPEPEDIDQEMLPDPIEVTTFKGVHNVWQRPDHGLFCNNNPACDCSLSNKYTKLNVKYMVAVLEYLKAGMEVGSGFLAKEGTRTYVLRTLLNELKRKDMLMFIGLRENEKRDCHTNCIPLLPSSDLSVNTPISLSPNSGNLVISINGQPYPLLQIIFLLFRTQSSDLDLMLTQLCSSLCKADGVFCVNPWHYEAVNGCMEDFNGCGCDNGCSLCQDEAMECSGNVKEKHYNEDLNLLVVHGVGENEKSKI